MSLPQLINLLDLSKDLLLRQRVYQAAAPLLLSQSLAGKPPAHYGELFNASPVGLVVLDRHGGVLEHNPRAAQLLGWSGPDGARLQQPAGLPPELGAALFRLDQGQRRAVVELGPGRRRVQVECRALSPGRQGRRLVSLCDLAPGAEEAADQKLPPPDLLRQMTHRAGNNLQMISSILSLELRASPRGLPPGRVASLLHRVKLMGESYRLLCRRPCPGKVELESFLRDLVQSLGRLASHQQAEIGLALQGRLPSLEPDRAHTLGLIIGELVTNAVRHAFFPGQGGMVRVEAASPDGRRVVVKVSDDGQGLPAEVDWKAGPSLGFVCIRSLAQRHLAAEISLSRGAGTCFTIRLRA